MKNNCTNDENEICGEVCLFLNSIDPQLVSCIPNDILSYFYSNSNIGTTFVVDIDKYNFSEKGKAFIAYLLYNYIANENLKLKLNKLFQSNEHNLEQEKIQKYDPNNIFNVPQEDSSINDLNPYLIAIENRNIFKRIHRFFKNLIKK